MTGGRRARDFGGCCSSFDGRGRPARDSRHVTSLQGAVEAAEGEVDISRRARMKRHAVSILILLTVRGLGLAVFPEVAAFRSPVLDFLMWVVGLVVIVFVFEAFDLGGYQAIERARRQSEEGKE